MLTDIFFKQAENIGKSKYITYRGVTLLSLKFHRLFSGNKKLRELKPARDARSCHITNIEPLAP